MLAKHGKASKKDKKHNKSKKENKHSKGECEPEALATEVHAHDRSDGEGEKVTCAIAQVLLFKWGLPRYA